MMEGQLIFCSDSILLSFWFRCESHRHSWILINTLFDEASTSYQKRLYNAVSHA